jgi:pimeloyl-ACP methyl ester carboxylesterase
MDPSGQKSVLVGGQAFECLDIGDGAPVLFLHGALGDARTFAPHCSMLADRWRTITYTQRHFGTRAWPENIHPFGVETHARDLIGMAETLDAGPLRVVAWSYAGHVALRVAQLRPELFRSMLVYETGFQTFMTDATEIAAFKADLQSMFAPIFAAVAEDDLEKAARLLVNASASDDQYFDSRTELQMRIELENAHMMPKLLAQMPPPRITEADLAALEVPVTIACGENSRPAYKLVSEAAMRILPGPHFMVPGVNHFWPDAEPAAFTEFVRAWLEAQA